MSAEHQYTYWHRGRGLYELDQDSVDNAPEEFKDLYLPSTIIAGSQVILAVTCTAILASSISTSTFGVRSTPNLGPTPSSLWDCDNMLYHSPPVAPGGEWCICIQLFKVLNFEWMVSIEEGQRHVPAPAILQYA